MPPAFTGLFDDLVFTAPLSRERADALVRFVADADPAGVVDVGCGWGELLLQVLAAAPRAHGTGIDADARSIDHGSALAGQRGLGGRVSWVRTDARTHRTPWADAVVAVGAGEIWGAPVEAAQPLDHAGALAVAAGFAPVAVGEAGPEGWDAFGSGCAARYATWLAGHPADHDDAPEVRERAARQRRAYLSGYRGVLGMAYLSLVAV